jgi:hypothetical protein
LIESSDKGFKEDNRYTDMKIFIAAVACVLGAVSHFYPIPFPQNKPLLAGCVVGYIICASLYYLIEKRYEGEAFYIARANGISKMKDYQRVRFSSDLDTSDKDCKYKLKVEGIHNTTGTKIEVNKEVAVTTFYDEGGYLHRYKVKEMFDETLNKLINAPR